MIWDTDNHSFFGDTLGLLHVQGSKRDFVWKKLWSWVIWGNVIGSVTGKTERGSGVRSNQYQLMVGT